jgi:hypothetical protein
VERARDAKRLGIVAAPTEDARQPIRERAHPIDVRPGSAVAKLDRAREPLDRLEARLLERVRLQGDPLLELVAGRAIVDRKRAATQRRVERDEQLVVVERLAHVAEGAGVQRAICGVGRPGSAHHDRGHLRLQRAQRVEERDARRPGQVHIREHEIGCALREQLERLLRRRRLHATEAVTHQKPCREPPGGRFVVDDEHRRPGVVRHAALRRRSSSARICRTRSSAPNGFSMKAVPSSITPRRLTASSL